MRPVVPYANLDALLHALDDGGFFFDPFSRKDDGEISTGELKKATGRNERYAIQWLALMTSTFTDDDRKRLRGVLSERLDRALARFDAQSSQPRRVETGVVGEFLLVEGVLKDATSSVKSTPFWISNGMASALGLEYHVWSLVGESPREGRALVLQSHVEPGTMPPVVDDVGRKMRISGVIESVKHDDMSPIQHLRPIFFWDCARPPLEVTDIHRPSSVKFDGRDALRAVLRHTPGRPRAGEGEGEGEGEER
jgi:hypothetical protein